MRNLILAALAASGLGLAVAPPARAQVNYPYGYGYGYPLYPADLYAIPPGGYGTRVYGPGYTYSYPYMYQSNNPSYVQRYTYFNYYQPGYGSPYGYYRGYNWAR